MRGSLILARILSRREPGKSRMSVCVADSYTATSGYHLVLAFMHSHSPAYLHARLTWTQSAKTSRSDIPLKTTLILSACRRRDMEGGIDIRGSSVCARGAGKSRHWFMRRLELGGHSVRIGTGRFPDSPVRGSRVISGALKALGLYAWVRVQTGVFDFRVDLFNT